MTNLEAWVALSCLDEIGHTTIKRLITVYDNPEAVFEASMNDLRSIEGISERKAKKIKEFSDWKGINKKTRRLVENGVRIITFRHAEYPAPLRQIDSSPAILYVMGDLKDEDRFAIAVVGPRKPTPYGGMVAERLSSELGESGFTIVSGMARGIDTIAHTFAIKAGARTIAVLGSGIDVPYPPENRGLMKKISDSGYVVSEFGPGTRPLKENFPPRNRIISGLSLGVLVVEATLKSGSLITANYALEQNREVFAVPGNINSPNSAGTNELIKRGAKLIQGTSDIIEELAPMLKGFIKRREKIIPDLTEDEKKLCDILSGEPLHIDMISRGAALSQPRLLALLLDLELKGVVRQAEGKRFYLAQ